MAGDALTAAVQSFTGNFGRYASGPRKGFDAHGLSERGKGASIADVVAGIQAGPIGVLLPECDDMAAKDSMVVDSDVKKAPKIVVEVPGMDMDRPDLRCNKIEFADAKPRGHK